MSSPKNSLDKGLTFDFSLILLWFTANEKRFPWFPPLTLVAAPALGV